MRLCLLDLKLFFNFQQNNSISFNSKSWSSSLALNQRTTSIKDAKRYTNTTICMLIPQTSSSKVTVSPLELEDPKDPPLNLYKPKDSYTAKIVSVERVVGPKAPGETCHIVIDHDGNLPYWEGQSYGVIPPVSHVPCAVYMVSLSSSCYHRS